jgi:hypothetical protein
MRLSSKKIAALVILSGVLLIALAGIALAVPPWPDANDAYWAGYSTAGLQITGSKVATVAGGYEDGTFKPANQVTRAQFAKMAVSGLDLATVDPDVPTFKDVAKGSIFYIFVEGARAESLIGGYATPAGLYFKPSDNITRQQTNTILGRYLSQAELDSTGAIHGLLPKTYGSMEEWYLWEGSFYIEGFLDDEKIAPDHRAATAYLVFRDVVQGSGGYLNPNATLNRAQAAVMVLRVAQAARDITTLPPAPVLLNTTPHNSGPVNWCSDPQPLIEGTAIPFGEVHVYDNGGSDWIAAGFADSTGHVSLKVQAPLGEGSHLFTAKVKNPAGLVSQASTAIAYLLDTKSPTVTIESPVEAGIYYTENHKPPFTALPMDERKIAGIEASGVARVDFLYAAWTEIQPTVWSAFTLISSSVTPTNEAAYSGSGLANGHYLLAVRAADQAGNESFLREGFGYADGVTQEVIIDDAPPVVNLTKPLAGELVPDDGTYVIHWTLTDVTPPDTVKIEVSHDYGDNWATIADAAANDGSYDWSVPDVDADDAGYKIRITAVDEAGAEVGDVAGHTTVAVSGAFTVYCEPKAPTNVVGSDTDATFAGVDGRDFHATWTVSVSAHIASQRIFILPAGQSLNLTTAPVDVAVEAITGSTTAAWTGLAGVTTDSQGNSLVAGEYRIWVVATDPAGRMAFATSPAFTVVSDSVPG